MSGVLEAVELAQCHCGSWTLPDGEPVIDEGWHHGSQSCYQQCTDTTPGQAVGPVSGFQPYARHYMHAHQLVDASQFRGVEFMRWIDGRWQEFADEISEHREKVRSTTHGARFAAWLAAGCPCGGVE